LGTWHEALTDAAASILTFDLMACWIYPSRGGSVLIGPAGLAADRVVPPSAEPLVAQEGIFAIEDKIIWAGYHSVMAVPIRTEVQDVGLIVVASFADAQYDFNHQRSLHRFGAAMGRSCRRLASHLWLPQSQDSEDPGAARLDITDRMLDATTRARDGADLVQLASDAVSQQLPHDRFELVAVAPAPTCWAMVGTQRGPADSALSPDTDAAPMVDAIVARMGSRDVSRISDLRTLGMHWPAAGDYRGAERLRSVLAVRLEVGGEIAGWLWLGSETPGWFREEDEALARHIARLLAPSVAAWAVRVEQAGAWG
jgi:GAF domain-containing protein